MKVKAIHPKGLFSDLRHDLPASVVVFLVAVPLCLGIALASGAPLFSGIIAGVVGGIVVGAVSNSSLGVSGPAAGLTVIVLAAIQQLGSFEVFLVAVVLAGLIQILLGILRAGIISYYFPSSVIKGMLSAIGIIIILKQIPHAVGYDADYEGDMTFIQLDGQNTFSELINMLGAISPGAVFVSLLSLVILFVWEVHMARRYPIFRLIQGPLVAIAAGIGYQVLTAAFFPEWTLGGKHLVSVPVTTGLDDFARHFSLPAFDAILRPDVWSVAITLAIVASIESLLSVEAIDKLDPQKRTTNNNRELVAQGCGNVVSGLLGGLPVTQVIIRSSANVQSGGRTKASAILHGILLLLCVAFLPVVLNLIPLAVLAAILLIVGYKLARPEVFRRVYALGWNQFLPFMATILGVVFTDLLKGIAMGGAVAVLVILRNSYKNSHVVHHEAEEGSRRVKVVLAEEVIFLNKGNIARELKQIGDGSEVTIDMSKSVAVDHDVMEMINDYKVQARSRNITVRVIRQKERELAEVEYQAAS
jgi:MFS superfamily sulfate permease-like transporter